MSRMPESFTLIINANKAEKTTRELLGQLADALCNDNYGLVRELINQCLRKSRESSRPDELVAALLLPCSSSAKTPFLDALCHTLEDASAFLGLAGSRKLSIDLTGNDDGTANAAAYLLALLDALPLEILDASAKGYTWMAQWTRDEHGVLRVAHYEPLKEGRKINLKADEKLRRKVNQDNALFLNSPLRMLADALPSDLCNQLFVSVDLDRVLGIRFSELLDGVASLPDQTGVDYRIGIDQQALTMNSRNNELFINTWNVLGYQQKLEINLNAQLSEKRIRQHLRRLPYKFSALSQIGEFYWERDGIKVCAKASDTYFELKLVRERL
jgi:hypothetical protein